MIQVSSNFDSGNIEVYRINEKLNDIQVKVRKDTNSDFLQWFHFRLTGAAKRLCKISIVNAGKTTYPSGWEGYSICASYDREEWFRIPCSFTRGSLSFTFKPIHNSVYFAYFAPYSYERHLDLVHQAQQADNVSAEVIGKTFEGRDIDMLVIGKPQRRKKIIWVIARQHPGEPMAEWFIEGFLERLLDPNDSVSKKILEDAVFYVIPNMNIDGSIAGNLRASASGANLNREWKNPTKKYSPEVFYTRKKMDETGMNLMLDVHGDEALPYNFVAASEGIPGYDEYLAKMEKRFIDNWMDACPDFQDTHKYPLDKPNEGNMTICTNQIAHRFGCLALTIEMPFKDNANAPDARYGWSDVRSKMLGASVLNPILLALGDLR